MTKYVFTLNSHEMSFPDCEFLLNLHKRFTDIIQTTEVKPKIFSFIETSLTMMACFYMKIIAYDSAGIPYKYVSY